MIKVVLVAGLTNGRVVYDYLQANKFVDLALVITFPDDCDKPRHTVFPDADNVIKDYSCNRHEGEISEIAPDFIIVAGWSELLSDSLLALPKLGTIGFHPSKLPNDRGRSVLAWQIEEGYTETALTMFFYNSIPDAGDIIAQEKVAIAANDYINDVLSKMDAATYNLMKAYFPLVRRGLIGVRKQLINEGSFRRLRDSQNLQINWDVNNTEIYNKVRALSNPYPGAEAVLDGARYKIWRTELLDDFFLGHALPVGTVVARLYDASFIVKCRKGYLHVTEWSQLTTSIDSI